ncbi:MAG: polysaccharide deacetylase family protein [Deltaproteobacteria bacterium]|nr:polysaccharide deacetylase family protein [Deltaproteobacteria bacterium]
MKSLFILLALILIVVFSMTSVYSSGKRPDNAPATQQKLCALTFDDGPSNDPELTPLVLDKLKSYDIRATFFLVGENMNDSTGGIIRQMVADGHEIGNHSWTYGDMSKMKVDEVKKSVDDTNRAIQKYAGVTPVFFRPPNLSTSSTMYKAIELPFASGVAVGDWPTGGGDTVDHIMEKLEGRIRDGVIILLHDVQPKPHPTPEALDTLIPKLIKEGYEFVTLSELFKRKGVVPDSEIEDMYVYVE